MARVIALVDDLMFLSRIREAARASGTEVVGVRSVEALLEACRSSPDLVLVDLDSERLRPIEAIGALRAEPGLASAAVVGFFSHVQAERARDAQAAGCTRVVPRSAFVKGLPELLKRPG